MHVDLDLQQKGNEIITGKEHIVRGWSLVLRIRVSNVQGTESSFVTVDEIICWLHHYGVIRGSVRPGFRSKKRGIQTMRMMGVYDDSYRHC